MRPAECPKLLDQGVTAIICCHDQMANAAMVQCREAGIKIPEDVSIVGFDDLPMCAYTEPPLTTVRRISFCWENAAITRWKVFWTAFLLEPCCCMRAS